jgi:hypothetical protein
VWLPLLLLSVCVAFLVEDGCGRCLTHNLQCSPFAPRVTPFCVSPSQMLIRCWRAQWALHYRKESEKALLLKLVCVGLESQILERLPQSVAHCRAHWWLTCALTTCHARAFFLVSLGVAALDRTRPLLKCKSSGTIGRRNGASAMRAPRPMTLLILCLGHSLAYNYVTIASLCSLVSFPLWSSVWHASL